MEGLKQFGKSRSRKGPEMKALEERIAALEGSGSLEERVRNLEAIVTDSGFQLNREFDELKRQQG